MESCRGKYPPVIIKKETMTRETQKKFLLNLLKFTAPGLAIFFAQLQMGADWKTASGTALLVVYGLLADLFSKIK